MIELPEMPCNELVELVTAYLDDALSKGDRSRFDLHLAECDGCREYLSQIKTTVRLSSQVASGALDPVLRERLLTSFRSWKAGGSRKGKRD